MTARSDGILPTLSTGAFRLAAAGVALFLVVAAALAYVVLRDTSAAITAEVTAGIEAEAARLEAAHRDGGLPGAERWMREALSAPGKGLYHLADAKGRTLAGNFDVSLLPPTPQVRSLVVSYAVRSAAGEQVDVRQGVLLRLELGRDGIAYVGRDIDSARERLTRLRMLLLATLVATVIAGLVAAFAAGRHVQSRVGALATTTRQIMDGEIGRRLALSDRGDEIDGLSANINAMLDRIELLMAGLREVSDNIAHDLKTPLNRLRNRAEAALRQDEGEAHREGLERVIEEADALIKTFNALLLIARLEAGAVDETMQSVDAAALVRDVAELYQPVAEEAGCELDVRVGGSETILANPHLVSQAIANLIDNAIKYSTAHRGIPDAAEPMRIAVTLTSDSDAIAIAVADSGPGIPEADRERAVRRFVRLERSRSRPGTGLGLSLVAAVARLHRGRLALEDNAPGLRVVLTLPRVQAR
ncbi:MAG: sensor histidine kinase [Hyphomicrobiaceae bacterium]